ncbi:MAG: hypothetical protein R3A45_10975 [Bdellovibrionota bacterium]
MKENNSGDMLVFTWIGRDATLHQKMSQLSRVIMSVGQHGPDIFGIARG